MSGGPAVAAGAQVVRADESHDDLLAGLYRRVWDAEATPERVRAARRAAAERNPADPGEEPPTFLFVLDGRAVGHVTTIPTRVRGPGGEAPAHWLKGLMVVPEHRNGPVGFLVLREALRHLGCAMAMVVAPEARRLFHALGFAEVGVLPNALRLLRPGRVLRRLDPAALAGALTPRRAAILRALRRPAAASAAGAGFAAAAGAWTLARGRPGGARGLYLPAVGPGELDRLWGEFREGVEAVPSRDAGYLRHRYQEADGAGYHLVGVRDGTGLRGMGAVRPPRAEGDPRLNGIRVATLSELVFPPGRPRLGLAVLEAAEAVARDLDADALLCSASHPAARSVLRRRAFLPVPGNVHFLLRDPAGKHPLPRSLDAWWLTRGDSAADEVF